LFSTDAAAGLIAVSAAGPEAGDGAAMLTCACAAPAATEAGFATTGTAVTPCCGCGDIGDTGDMGRWLECALRVGRAWSFLPESSATAGLAGPGLATAIAVATGLVAAVGLVTGALAAEVGLAAALRCDRNLALDLRDDCADATSGLATFCEGVN